MAQKVLRFAQSKISNTSPAATVIPCSPRQNYLYLCGELTRPYLFKARFASNHAPLR
jgi:hypothetical protein